MIEKKGSNPSHPVRLRVAALIEHDQSIVLIFDPVYRGGCWILPGGGAEFDETIVQAVEREVLEETGLTVLAQEFCSLREIWEPEKDFPQNQVTRKTLEMIFVCKYISGEININNNPSKKLDGISRVRSCRWVNPQIINGKIDGFPLYPREFFDLYVSNNLVRISLDKVLLHPCLI